MTKKTLYGADARQKILEGVKKISAAVKVTLGPLGRNVIIAQSGIVNGYDVRSLPLHVSKDGYTVTKAFDLDDPFEKVGVLMIKECAQKSVDQSGDGTTTTCILAEAIFEKGMELVNAGANPLELKKGIDKAVEYVVAELKKMAIPVAGDVERIRQVATVSANNDKEIGDLIADAFAKIGDYGVINIEEAKGVETEVKVIEGVQIERGWISPYFVNNREKQICEFDNPLILLYQNRLTHHTQYQKAVELSVQMQRPLVIICEDADEEGLATLAMNNQQGRIRCCIIRSPFFGQQRLEAMEDIALATGGTFISDSKGLDIKEMDASWFGQCKRISVSKDETIIAEGFYEKEKFADFINELKMNLTQAKGDDEKEVIEKRIARLTGGIAVIYVGGATETEMKEKKDRVDDAVRATKAAIAEGFVAGGGAAFIRCMKSVLSSEEVIGIFNQTGNLIYGESNEDFINSILIQPLKQICINAGVDSDSILKQVVDAGKEVGRIGAGKNDLAYNWGGKSFGYNAKTDTIEDLVLSGIIDPVKVLRCALQNAASSSGMILTSECLICDTL